MKITFGLRSAALAATALVPYAGVHALERVAQDPHDSLRAANALSVTKQDSYIYIDGLVLGYILLHQRPFFERK